MGIRVAPGPGGSRRVGRRRWVATHPPRPTRQNATRRTRTRTRTRTRERPQDPKLTHPGIPRDLSTIDYNLAQYCTVQQCAVLYSTVQYSTVQYCAVLPSTVQYCTVLHSTAQYCTVLLNPGLRIEGFRLPSGLGIIFRTVGLSRMVFPLVGGSRSLLALATRFRHDRTDYVSRGSPENRFLDSRDQFLFIFYI